MSVMAECSIAWRERGGTKVRTNIFLTNYNHNDNKIYTYHGYTLYIVEINFPTKSSLQTPHFQTEAALGVHGP